MDGRDKKNEMEQIRRGLEAFLNSELKGTEAGEHDSREERILKDGKGVHQRASGIIRSTGNGYFEEENLEDDYFGKKYSEKKYSEKKRSRAGQMGTEYWEEGEFQEGYPGIGASEENDPEAQDIKVIHFGQEASGDFGRDGWEEADMETEAVDWDLAGRKSKAGTRQARGNPSGTRRRTADTGPSRDYLSDSSGSGKRMVSVRQPREDSAPGRQPGGTPGKAAGPQSRPAGKNHREKRESGKKTPGEQEEKNGAMGKKKSRLKSGLCRLLIAAVLIISLLGFGLYQLVGLAYEKMNFREIASLADLPMKEDGVVNILLIGNDSRKNGEDGRSDAMILLSVSSRTKTIYMTSLLRDMYVEIPGYDGNRLNAAYSFGGAELLMETIKKNFDISVNRYISVNFEAFANLVDAVGGIELELTSEEIEYVNGYLVEYNMLTERPQGTDNMDTSVSGLVHLNGPQALAYSRNRYLGTDFGRTERQRKVLTAVIGKAPGALLTNMGGLLDGLMPNLTTNLTRQECFRLSLMAGKLFTYDIVSDSIPQPGTYEAVYIREMAVLQVDFGANVRYLKEKLYGE